MSVKFTCEYARAKSEAERARLLDGASFGDVFTDHMIAITWSSDRAWHDARVKPFGPLMLEPSAQVFHYGQAVFEGMKAYGRADGSVWLFRPHANAARMVRSCQRIAMPALPEETFVRAIELLVTADRDWVPRADGESLYLRPFMIASQATIGLYRRSSEFKFAVIACPASGYFKTGGRPVSVWLCTEFTRAANGGTGAVKFSGNYAGTLLAQEQASQRGCDQVVWLDAVEHRWVDEMGTSNIFFVFGSRVVTPPLSGTLLPGITRDSLLTLARDLDHTVEERPISVEEWRSAAANGSLTEVFSSGTSSIVTPVGLVKHAGGEFLIGDGRAGAVTTRLKEALLEIQFGRSVDRHGWMHRVV